MAVPDEILAGLESTSMSGHVLSKLKYASQLSRGALETAFERLDLTVPQFLALAFISENEDISSAELARLSYVSPQAMIAVVARLCAARLVQRAPATGGGRSLTMRLTPEGKRLLERGRLHAMAIERYLFEKLGAEGFISLTRGLDAVTEALGSAETITKTTAPWDRFVPPDA